MAWPKGKPRNPVTGVEEAPVVEREPTALELREYDRRVSAGLYQQYEALAAKVRAVLVADLGSDMADRMMADIAPVLKDPNREARRRRVRPVAA